jgi:hypothetical protein
MSTDLENAFHKDLIRFSKRVQLIKPQMRLEMEYTRDNIP